MILKDIEFSNFRIFKDIVKYNFDSLNLIIGNIGEGKSTLSKIGILFCLYGYSEVPINRLPNKFVKGDVWVKTTLELNKRIIVIKREVPAKVTITEDGIDILSEALDGEKTEWIVQKFGTLDYFKKFRMIDTSEGSDILKEGKTSLRKILVSFNESVLNNVREVLQKRKQVCEKFNKDDVVLFKHFPSEKRLSILNSSIETQKNQRQELQKEYGELYNTLMNLSNRKGSLENVVSYNTVQKNKVLKNPVCPTCYQNLPETSKKKTLVESEKNIVLAQKELKNLTETIEDQKRATQHTKNLIGELENSIQKIVHLKSRLENRFLQKDCIYTTKDVLICSNAIKELDKFYSFYILKQVKKLEPIINSIICKIGFELNFHLNTKGDFDLLLKKEGQEFIYKELSTGQRLLLSISFQLALLLSKGETGLIIADEGFTNLNEETMISLYNVLKELPFQIVSVVHRFSASIPDMYIINLTKTEGDSNGRGTERSGYRNNNTTTNTKQRGVGKNRKGK